MTENDKYELHIIFRDDDNAQPMRTPYKELVDRPVTVHGIANTILERMNTVQGLNEHFISLFDRALRDTYTVKIEDYEFDPSRVLLDCETTEGKNVYGKLFFSWLKHYIELEIIPKIIDDNESWVEDGVRIWAEPYVWYVVRIPEREYADSTDIYPEYTLEDALNTSERLWEEATPIQESAIANGTGVFDIVEVTSEFFDMKDNEKYIMETHWDYANE